MSSSYVIEEFWNEYVGSIPPVHIPGYYTSWSFGRTPEQADRLGRLVKYGMKTATSSLLWEYAAEGSEMPAVGDLSIILDGSSNPLCVIETTAVQVLPFNEVGQDHAAAEGEGDRSLAYWREVHWTAFSKTCQKINRTPAPDMPVVCETFRRVYVRSSDLAYARILPEPSFLYGGARFQDLVGRWEQTVSYENSDWGELRTTRYADPDSGLRVSIHVRRFVNYPAVDWVVELENAGGADTPLIAGLLPLDVIFAAAETDRVRLHHANGSLCQMDDFLPFTSEITPGKTLSLAPQGGRSSNGVLPFMNFQWGGGGAVLAVGWSGQWQMTCERTASALHVTAGMQRTNLYLKPGEKIRTPRILWLRWEGSQPETGTNLLRQLLLDHYVPRLDGALVQPPVAQCMQFYFYLTGQANEALEQKVLPRAAELGADAHWIDACWFGAGGEWWQEVGTWTVNPLRFPRGLGAVSAAAHAAGMKFVLWFEPERVRPGSQLDVEQRAFLLESPADPTNLLYDLGNPAALDYLTEMLAARIAETGLDIYRQDFNFDPLPYWQAADAPDRVGMSEIAYITGLYRLWDDLRARFPHLWIDNCSSGGRRIDLETVSRALPLWPSDFHDTVGLRTGPGLHIGDQCITAGLARWVPLFGGGVWNFTPYGARGHAIGGFMFGFHIDRADYADENAAVIVNPNDIMKLGKTLLDDDFPMEAARAAIAENHRLRPYLTGDFYLLVPLTVQTHDWCAWQFHRPDLRAGAAVFQRRHASPFASLRAGLRQVDPDARYLVSLSPGFDEAPRREMSGRELAEIVVTIPEQPGSLLLQYSQIDS
jgi:alpha-galactosidase